MTTRAPVSVCLIFRDDPLLEQAVASVRPYVKQVCIAIDADAPWKSRSRAEVVADAVTAWPWEDDFALARNRSFESATEPYVMWMDTDDVVVGAENIHRELGKATKGLILGTVNGPSPRLIAPYDYETDPKTGLVTRQQWRERLVPNDGTWVWEHPTHEGLTKRDGSKYDPGLDYWMDGVRWVHKRTETGSRARSLRILEKWLAAGHDDAWTHINLGFELHAAHRYAEAIGHFARHVELSGWPEERTLACLRAADCALAVDFAGGDRYASVKAWIDRAERITPNSFEVHFARAKLARLRATILGEEGANAEVIEHCAYALTSPETRTPVGRNPAERAFEVHDFMRVAAEIEGDWDTALRAAERALEAVPEHAQILFARKRYATAKLCSPVKAPKVSIVTSRGVPEDKLVVLDAKSGSFAAADLKTGAVSGPHHLDDDRYPGRAGSVAPADGTRVPSELERGAAAETHRVKYVWNPPAFRVADHIRPGGPVASKREPLEVAFMCGPAREPWNPDTVATRGHGGSETAVVEVAKRLAKLGHRVTVYGAPGEEGTFAGVDYVTWTPEVRPEVDVLVAWRLAPLLPQGKAKVRLMWCHDVEAIGMTYELSLLADRFLALSAWHLENLVEKHGIPESQVVITRNGVDPALYAWADVKAERVTGGWAGTVEAIERDSAKAIYCSSPDRGLGALLEMWPAIRARVPASTLDVYYSFENWARDAEERKDQQHRFLVATLQRQMARMAPLGVRYHGRVNRKVLSRAMVRAGAWLYPTWYPETSCMSAMEARAAGLRIVTSPVGALPETVGEYGRLVDGDWLSVDYQDRFTDAAVEALYFDSPTPGRYRGKTREETRDAALRAFDWAGVAAQWDDLFRLLVEEAARGALPEYREYREAVGT